MSELLKLSEEEAFHRVFGSDAGDEIEYVGPSTNILMTPDMLRGILTAVEASKVALNISMAGDQPRIQRPAEQ